uniref:Uncharacterized protein n=1 Tax=viral metagenome TaxID=1070528 RepID=A0A6M3L030_9ZZZZ
MCFLRKKIEIEKIAPTSTQRIGLTQLFNLIKSEFPTCDVYLSDKDYRLCSYDDIALFMAQDETNKIGYESEDFDCDDFAYRLMGQFSVQGWADLCFGIIWTETHAFNLFVTEDKEILFIEPQTDEIRDTLFSGNIARLVVI